MTGEELFRWFFVVAFIAPLSLSAYFRRRARKSAQRVQNLPEGKPDLLSPPLFTTPLYLSGLAYMLNPNWMAWSSFPLPTGLRWAAGAVALAMMPLLFWIFRTIGRYVFESSPAKESRALVTNGPYRWVRHPLYAVASLGWVSLAVLAANWFMLAMAFVRITGISLLVIPREEDELIGTFGARYREYMRLTGKLVPRLRIFE